MTYRRIQLLSWRSRRISEKNAPSWEKSPTLCYLTKNPTVSQASALQKHKQRNLVSVYVTSNPLLSEYFR
jgi:hypothetical protein